MTWGKYVLPVDLSRFSFGATSAITTSLALIVGLDATTNPRMSIVGALLILAIADNISDSLGIHVYRESQSQRSDDAIKVYSITNFLTRFAVTLAFVAIVLSLPLWPAILASLALGLLVLSVLSYLIAAKQGANPYTAVLHHVGVAVVVMLTSHLAGNLISRMFVF